LIDKEGQTEIKGMREKMYENNSKEERERETHELALA